MRATAIAVFGVLMVPVTAPAQTDGWAKKLFLKDGVPALDHDFGTVPRGALISHKFPITNIYAVPLQITGLRASCGCVTAVPSSSVLQPLESGYIEITMDARRFAGPKTVSVYVTVGPQFNSTATLQVTANSRTDVVFNPGEVNFHVVPQGQTPTQTIDVEYAGTLDWRVSGVTVPPGTPLEVKAEEAYRRPGQVGYRLAVRLKPDAPAGVFKHEVSLQTNDPATPLVPVLVEGTVQAPLAVVPGNVSFGAVPIGQVQSRRVVVRGNSKPFRIVSVEGQGDGINVELPPVPAAVQVVTIKFQPAKAGEVRKTLRFRTSLEQDAIASVTVDGSGAYP